MERRFSQKVCAYCAVVFYPRAQNQRYCGSVQLGTGCSATIKYLKKTLGLMKWRCTHNPDYVGIKICAGWQNPNSFATWALENGYEKGLTIDRIDSFGNYNPTNCRWVTKRANNRNKKIQCTDWLLSTRRCSKCHTWKPLISFTVDNRKPSGRGHTCYVCAKEYQRKYKLTHGRSKNKPRKT